MAELWLRRSHNDTIIDNERTHRARLVGRLCAVVREEVAG